MLTIVSAVKLLFVSVIACDALDVFCVTLPKARVVGAGVAMGKGTIVIVPVPEREPVPETFTCAGHGKAQMSNTRKSFRVFIGQPSPIYYVCLL